MKVKLTNGGKIKLTLLGLAAVIAMYACHIAGVASMPGPNQVTFLDSLYGSQFVLLFAIIGAYFLGRFLRNSPRWVKLTLLGLTTVVALYACHIAGVASMPGPNQIEFLDTLYGSEALLVVMVVGGYFLGGFQKKRQPTVNN